MRDLEERDAPPAVEITETPEEEAQRVAWNIAYNKSFINLDMRAYRARDLMPKIQTRYDEEYAKIVKQRAKSNNPVVPIQKEKKSKKRKEKPVAALIPPTDDIIVPANPTGIPNPPLPIDTEVSNKRRKRN